jgi:dihydrofolate reductase
MSDTESFDPRAFHAQFDIAMIVACARNGVIGRDGDLPWHLPEDLRHFMRSTKGCPVIMGRKTYESLDKPLPARINIVVSRSMPDPEVPGVIVVGGLDEGIEAARGVIERGEAERPIWIAGGGTIYTQMLERGDLIVRTLIDCEVEGDASFPELDPSQWDLRTSSPKDPDDRHAYGFTIEWWTRVPASK